MHISSILSLMQNILSCIIHQLNINKCITKQYHEMTIEYLSLFVSWVDSLFQLHHLLHSQQHHFLSKCSILIRGSSRIEFFIFLIAWGIFFESWNLDLQLLPSYFGVFREETCGIRWSSIESTIIFLALTKFFLCKAFSLISLWNWNLSTYVGVQFISFKK